MTDVEKLAINIFTTGKLIKDLISNVQKEYLKECGIQKRYGDLSLPQLEAVKLIRRRGTVSMIELSELLMVTPPSASTMVDRLVDKGVLIRRQSDVDRRRVIVEVSSDAVEDIIGVENAMIQTFVALLEKLGSEAGQMWCETLEQVKDILVEQQ